MVLVEGRGHADDDRVHLIDFGVVRRGAKARLLRFLNGLGQDAHDVGIARIESAHLARLACDDFAMLRRELVRQRHGVRHGRHLNQPGVAVEHTPDEFAAR